MIKCPPVTSQSITGIKASTVRSRNGYRVATFYSFYRNNRAGRRMDTLLGTCTQQDCVHVTLINSQNTYMGIGNTAQTTTRLDNASCLLSGNNTTRKCVLHTRVITVTMRKTAQYIQSSSFRKRFSEFTFC